MSGIPVIPPEVLRILLTGTGPRVDCRKVSVDGRYLRPGDRIQYAEWGEVTVGRVTSDRLTFEGPRGTLVLTDEDAAMECWLAHRRVA